MTVCDMLFIAAALLASISLIAVQLRTGVPAMPSSRAEHEAAIALLERADLPANPRIFELGSGWGGLALALARAFPQAHVIGVELSPLPFIISFLRALRAPNLTVRWGNFLKTPLHDADAVACYLMIAPMPALAAKLDRELRAGTKVAAVMFWFRDRELIAKTQAPRAAVALYAWPGR